MERPSIKVHGLLRCKSECCQMIEVIEQRKWNRDDVLKPKGKVTLENG